MINAAACVRRLPFVLLKSRVVTLCSQKVHWNAVPPVHRFGCVISHIFIVVLLPVRALGNRCATLLLYHVPSRETLAMLPVIVRFPASVILSPRPEYSRMSARISFSRLEISDAGDYLPGCALRSDRDHRRFTMAAISSVFCAIRPSIGARCCCSRRSSSL